MKSVAPLILAVFATAIPHLAVIQPAAAAAGDRSHPNVVVILTDDQGWGDLSLNGNSNLSTPSIDSLARDGASFDYFYVCQVCAPTRAEFLTGRYYPSTGVSGVSRGEERLDPEETTVAQLFKKHEYATGAFGKWHNGTQPPYHPNFRGFDEFYGFTSGHWGHYFSPPLDHNGKPIRGNGFVIDDFTDQAIQFIRRSNQRGAPFFCYLPYNTPHSPMMVPDEFYRRFEGVDPPMRHRDSDKEDLMMTRAALAMVENIDWNVGRVLQTLEDLRLVDDTIVVFFCDNGPNSFRWNGDMKGRKGSIDEGGVRSPLLVRWPGTIPANTQIGQISGAIDLLPTLCELAGVTAANVETDRREEPETASHPSRCCLAAASTLLVQEQSSERQRPTVSTRRFRKVVRYRRRSRAAGRTFPRNNPHAPKSCGDSLAFTGTGCARRPQNTPTGRLPSDSRPTRRCRRATEFLMGRSSEVRRRRTTPSSRTGATQETRSPGTSR